MDQATAAAVEQVPPPSEAPKQASPAQDLRDVQMLLIGGIFPGNMAPAIVKAYQLLDKMCVEIESAAK